MTIDHVDVGADPQIRCDFDIHDHSQADQIYEIYDDLRERCPVAHSSQHGGYWLVTGYEQVKEIYRDHDTFSSGHTNIPRIPGQDSPMLPLETDPPEHSVYRKLLTPLFSPPRMRSLEAEIEAIIDRLIDALDGKSEIDFVEDFAKPLPATVFLELMGWPHDDADMLCELVDGIVLGLPGTTPEEVQERKEEAATAAYAYFAEMLDDRMENPDAYPDDITAQLVSGTFEDRDLTQFEILNMLFLVMIAGLDTVQGALAHSIMHFAEHPDVRRQLVENPDIVDSAVEEMLRWESAVAPARDVVKDTTLDGVEMKAGDPLMFCLGAANRDPAKFAEPNSVDLTREPNPHLAFGAGVHRCIGSHLARIEMRLAFTKFHQRVPDYRLDPTNPPKIHLSQIKGVETLPLVLGQSI